MRIYHLFCWIRNEVHLSLNINLFKENGQKIKCWAFPNGLVIKRSGIVTVVMWVWFLACELPRAHGWVQKKKKKWVGFDCTQAAIYWSYDLGYSSCSLLMWRNTYQDCSNCFLISIWLMEKSTWNMFPFIYNLKKSNMCTHTSNFGALIEYTWIVS